MELKLEDAIVQQELTETIEEPLFHPEEDLPGNVEITLPEEIQVFTSHMDKIPNCDYFCKALFLVTRDLKSNCFIFIIP